ncbi:MAG: tetratricopeptide repeat protein, partial [Deltaproteobacteria bacterium]|nr:tetratricopeptide repeat protein [Deltaproteobacteria bacterium]
MVSKKEKYLVSAQKFIERGQWDKALAEYAKVVLEDPKDARTWLKMAEVHAKRGANAEAAEIYMRTGDLYVEQGFAQKAVAVYKNVLKLSPAAVPAHLKVGALFNQLGLVSDAVQQFELAAAALQRLEKFTEASAALRQALDIQPDNVVLRVKLAESASQAGLIEEAVREFDKAADQLKAQGRADESLRVLERLIFLQPDNFTKARELAEAYIARGKPRLALSKLQACLNGDPRDPRILSLLARALEQLGQVPKAVSVLKELVHLCDDLGRTSERDAAVLRGLILDPTDSELLATSAQYKVRVAAGDAAIDVTPPPLARQGPAADTGARRGGSFDLSGVVVRSPLDAVLPSASGRVAAPVGIADSGKRDPFDSSQGVGGGVGSDVDRILAEADVFVKYGLLERAADHLMRVFDIEPEQREARERLIGVLQRLGRKEEAIWHTDILSQQGAAPAAPADADKSVPISVSLSPDEGLLPFEPLQISGPNRSLGVGSDEITIDDGDIDDPAAGMLTPPPSDGWSQDHVQEPIDVLSKDVMTEFDAEIRTGDVMTVIGTAQLEADGEADEDPASAFSDDIATITGDPEVVLAAFAAFDEEELSAELEAVSFFLDQSMLEEARALL